MTPLISPRKGLMRSAKASKVSGARTSTPRESSCGTSAKLVRADVVGPAHPAAVEVTELPPSVQRNDEARLLVDPVGGIGVLEGAGEHGVDDESRAAREVDSQELARPPDALDTLTGQVFRVSSHGPEDAGTKDLERGHARPDDLPVEELSDYFELRRLRQGCNLRNWLPPASQIV